MNCPAEEFQSFERLFFQLEQAHWFYEDFLREKDGRLPGFSLKDFCAQFFEFCPLLNAYRGTFDENYAKFHSYKVRVPTCGAIMMNSDLTKMVLVRGWKPGSGWGFPKGKINKDEDERECAIREVIEETGFDCRPYLGSETDFLEIRVQTQTIRLYLATNVPEDTAFATQTRKEIGRISWFNLNEIPHNNSFYMVVPFLPYLKNWVKCTRKAMRTNMSQSASAMHLLGLSPASKPAKSKRGNRQARSDQTSGLMGQQGYPPLPLQEHDPMQQMQSAYRASGQTRISLMHLLQPQEPAKEDVPVQVPQATVPQDCQWQAWNMPEMHRMQCSAMGVPASMPSGNFFPQHIQSSSLPSSLPNSLPNSQPSTPELTGAEGLMSLLNIPQMPVKSSGEAAGAQSMACSKNSASPDGSFHFDKSKILGAMIF